MPRLPTGTVTFLFTDMEGSTRLIQEVGDLDGAKTFVLEWILSRRCSSS